MKEQKRLDHIDKEIIKALSINARTPIIEISKNLRISTTAIHKRVRKLEDAGIITGSKVSIDYPAIGFSSLAFIGIYLSEASKNSETVAVLKKIPEVLECHYTTGNWSILVKMICMDNEHLMQLLYTKIQTIEGVSRTETFISLHQQIDRCYSF